MLSIIVREDYLMVYEDDILVRETYVIVCADYPPTLLQHAAPRCRIHKQACSFQKLESMTTEITVITCN